jgi:hypothetical protein
MTINMPLNKQYKKHLRMNFKNLCLSIVTSIGISIVGYSQQPPTPQPLPSLQSILLTQRHHSDSLHRVLLKDSLKLSEAMVMQVIAIKDSCIDLSERILSNINYSPQQRNLSVIELRRQATEATKELLGEVNYSKYLRLISGQ